MQISTSVMHERLDGEVIALDMSTGKYFSMSGSAADVWYLLPFKDDLSDLQLSLMVAFPGEVDFEGLTEFVSELKELGLVLASQLNDEKENLPGIPNDYARGSWLKPKIFSYDDLSDLILIDPVHDTSDQGWQFPS